MYSCQLRDLANQILPRSTRGSQTINGGTHTIVLKTRLYNIYAVGAPCYISPSFWGYLVGKTLKTLDLHYI